MSTQTDEAKAELREWLYAALTPEEVATLRGLALVNSGWAFIYDAGGGSFVRRDDGFHVRARDFFEEEQGR